MHIPRHLLLQPHPIQRRVSVPAPVQALVAARGAAYKAHECRRLVLQELHANHAVDAGVTGGRGLGGELAPETLGALGGHVLAQKVGEGVADADFHQ